MLPLEHGDLQTGQGHRLECETIICILFVSANLSTPLSPFFGELLAPPFASSPFPRVVLLSTACLCWALESYILA
jgi:hypothetical protein